LTKAQRSILSEQDHPINGALMKTQITDNDVFDHYFSFAVKSKPMKAIETIFSQLLHYGK